MSEWRVGSKVPINVYEGDSPICQCHTAIDAKRIVDAVNRESNDSWTPKQVLGKLRHILDTDGYDFVTQRVQEWHDELKSVELLEAFKAETAIKKVRGEQ